MPLSLILILSFNPTLIRTRSLALQSAGHVVVSACSLKETIDYFRFGDFDLVLLSDAVPTRDRDCLIKLIRESGSRIPIVSIASVSDECDACATLTPGESRIEFLAGIRNVLMEAAKAYAKSQVAEPYGRCVFEKREAFSPRAKDGK